MTVFKSVYGTIFILLFFVQFAIYIVPGTTAGNIQLGLFLLILFYISLLLLDYRRFIGFIQRMLKFPVVKVLFYFLAFVTVSMIAHIVLGHYKAPMYYYFARVYKFYICSILVTFFPVLGLFYGIKLRDVIKYIYIVFILIFLLGIIQYIAIKFAISPLLFIFKIFTNAKETLYLDGGETASLYFKRVSSIFSEPSELGQFIFVFAPIAIVLSVSKYKIFDNIWINKLAKSSMIFLILLNLFLTKSPIYLVLVMIEFFLLLIILNIKKIKKNLIMYISYFFFLVCFWGVFFFLFKDAIQESYLTRILNTILSFGNFSEFVVIEPSLATRIVNYSIQFVSVKYNPLFGAGLTNIDIFLNNLYLKISPLPMTNENYFFHYNIPFMTATNKSVVWTSLAEFGIVGFSLYLWFVFKVFKGIIRTLKKKLLKGLSYDFLFGCFLSLIATSFISFYNLSMMGIKLWIMYGFYFACIYAYYFSINRRDHE